MSITVDINDRELRSTFLSRVLPDALGRLEEDALPAWGAMTPQQMVEHLIWTFMVSRGAIEVSCDTPEPVRERMRRFFYDDRPMPRDFQNPVLADGLPAPRHANLTEAREALGDEVRLFLDYHRDHPDAIHMHPVFGAMSMEEWERVHCKHCVHHLLQFDLA